MALVFGLLPRLWAVLYGIGAGIVVFRGWYWLRSEVDGRITWVPPAEKIPLVSSLRLILVLAFIQLIVSLIPYRLPFNLLLTVGFNAGMVTVIAYVIVVKQRFDF